MEIYVLCILIPLSILNILFDINSIILIINAVLLIFAIGISFYCSMFKKVVCAGFLYYYIHFGVIQILYSLIGNILIYNGVENTMKWIILVIQFINIIIKQIMDEKSKGRIY